MRKKAARPEAKARHISRHFCHRSWRLTQTPYNLKMRLQPNQATSCGAGDGFGAGGIGRANAQDAAPRAMELPRRPLGKTGVDITILGQDDMVFRNTY